MKTKRRYQTENSGSLSGKEVGLPMDKLSNLRDECVKSIRTLKNFKVLTREQRAVLQFRVDYICSVIDPNKEIIKDTFVRTPRLYSIAL